MLVVILLSWMIERAMWLTCCKSLNSSDGGGVGQVWLGGVFRFKAEFADIVKKETVGWSQKARVDWAREGACNMIYIFFTVRGVRISLVLLSMRLELC